MTNDFNIKTVQDARRSLETLKLPVAIFAVFDDPTVGSRVPLIATDHAEFDRIVIDLLKQEPDGGLDISSV
jgi:hypothetical protein